jgi:hypothetical protein
MLERYWPSQSFRVLPFQQPQLSMTGAASGLQLSKAGKSNRSRLRSGIGPGCVVDCVISKHATPTYHEVVSRAVGPQEAVSLEVVAVHEAVALVHVIRVKTPNVTLKL